MLYNKNDQNIKFLFPGTKFIVTRDKQLIELSDNGESIDWTNHVINWEPFLDIIGDNYVHILLLEFGGFNNEKLIFYDYPLYQRSKKQIIARDVISNKELKFKKNKNKGVQFIVSWNNKKLLQLDDGGHRINISHFVKTFDPLKKIIRADCEFEDTLILNFNSNDEKLYFYNYIYPSTGVSADNILDSAYLTYLKDIIKGSNSIYYNTYRKWGDDIVTLINAFKKSGMSREEAVEFAKIAVSKNFDFKRERQ